MKTLEHLDDPAVRWDAPANPILRLNPITVITILTIASVLSFFFDYWFTVGMLVGCLVVAALAGKLRPFLSMWFRTLFVLSAFIMVLQTLLYPGKTVIGQLWIFNITQQGLNRGIGIVTHVIAIGTAIILGNMIVDIRRLTRALEQRGTSPTASYVILSTMNMIPQMAKKMTTIMDAQRSRGIETDASVWVRAKAFIPTIGPLILNSVVGVEERALTLEARGFSAPHTKTSLVAIPDTTVDKLLRTVAYIGLVVAVAVRIWLWTR